MYFFRKFCEKNDIFWQKLIGPIEIFTNEDKFFDPSQKMTKLLFVTCFQLKKSFFFYGSMVSPLAIPNNFCT